MKVLGIIPARSGSKRLPGKALLKLGNTPLWAIAADQAEKAGLVPVVTTNIQEILQDDPIIAESRPEHLCQDTTPIEDVISHVLESHPGYEALVLLNPTHPLRHVEDIKLAVAMLSDFPSCTGVRKDYSYTIAEGANFPTLNEQVRIPRLVVTGGIYAVRVPAFMEKRKLMITGNITRGTYHLEQGPHVDINTLDDYLCARMLWETKR